MLVELTMTPLGRGTHLGQDLAPILMIIEESGLPYCLPPTGTCIEGEWDEVLTLVKQCHERMRGAASRAAAGALRIGRAVSAAKIQICVIRLILRPLA